MNVNINKDMCLTIIFHLLQLISQNQERFIQMLNAPLDEEGTEPSAQGAGGLGPPPTGGEYIQVTPQEKEAIDRVSLTIKLWHNSINCILDVSSPRNENLKLLV